MRTNSFFRRNDEEVKEKEIEGGNIDNKKNELINNKPEINRTITKKYTQPTFKEFEVLDTSVVKYVIERFPDSANDIKDSLINLYNTLENTIDNIEDESSRIIKLKRDFKLSEEYRGKSIKIYTIGQDIKSYVEWMSNVHNNKVNRNEREENGNNIVTSRDESINEFRNSKKIYEDFTMIEPKAFKINEFTIKVEDWDDLLVKTAEVLTKNYRNNRFENIPLDENVNIVNRKSQNNGFRDTVIEMLTEYKINLNDFEIKY